MSQAEERLVKVIDVEQAKIAYAVAVRPRLP